MSDEGLFRLLRAVEFAVFGEGGGILADPRPLTVRCRRMPASAAAHGFFLPAAFFLNENGNMKKIFFNPAQCRLRAGWRIGAFFISLFVCATLANFVMKKLIPSLIFRSLAGFLIIPAVAFGTLWLAGRFVDHRKFRDYGFRLTRKWGLDFLFGFLLGGVLFSMIFLFERARGWISVVDILQNHKEGYGGLPFALPLVMGLVACVIVGYYEEIAFRANLMTNLSEGFNRKNSMPKKAVAWAYVFSSLAFGLSHAFNPNATVVGVVNIVLGGFFLGLPFVLSGELAVPWALHISWNFFQGHVFGFPVSGLSEKISVFVLDQRGPRIWTGGEFGPEGGFVGTFAILIGCVFILFWLKMTKRPLSLFAPLAEYHSPHRKKPNQARRREEPDNDESALRDNPKTSGLACVFGFGNDRRTCP